MKVLQILPELNAGGVERGTLELAAHLVQEGHGAWVVSNGGRLVEALESAGARHVAMPVHRKSPLTLALVPRFRRLLREIRPDILHIRSRVPGWVAWLAWRGMDPETRPRLVSTVHGFYSVNAYSAVMTKGERVICVSHSVRQHVLQNYPRVPPERLVVIHRGIDPAVYPHGYRPPAEWLEQWYNEFPNTKNKFLITLPGRVTRRKGHEDLILLMAALPKEQAIHAVIAGGAEPKKAAYLAELKDLATKHGVSDRLTFAGHRNDMKEVLALSDAVLSLSRKPESFGRTTLEALSLGRPVLGYNHGGVGEILGRLFPQGLIPVGDGAALRGTLQQWMKDLPTPKGNPLFTLEKMLRQTVACYGELLLT